MSAPYFSIVVPCHNRAALLARLLDSLAVQDNAPCHEVIVVDDGSTDGSFDVAAAHGVGAQCLRLETSQGPGHARNLGASRARGEFVMFIDSDDVLPLWTLATCASALTLEPEADVVLLTEQTIGSGAGQASMVAGALHYVRHASYAAAAAAGHEFGGGKCVLRRAVFAASDGFATAVRVCEDQDLGFRLSAAGPCVVVHSPVCIGRGTGHGQLMDDHAAWFDGMRYLMARERSGLYPRGAHLRHMRGLLMSRSFRALTVALVRDGAWRKAFRAYLCALALHSRARAWRFMLLFPPWALLTVSRSVLARSLRRCPS